MEDVRVWLNSKRVYADGVALYLKHGTDSRLKNLFAHEACSDFKKKKLGEELENLLDKKTPIDAIKIPQQTSYLTHHQGWPANTTDDAVLNALHGQWRPLYGEMTNLQARLYDVALQGNSDSNKRLEACQMAHRILKLDDECQEIYAQREFYLLNGRLPEQAPPPDLVGDPVVLAMQHANYERYVRDYKNKLAKNPNNEKWAQKLKTYQEKLAWIKKQLRLDGPVD
jgi:hypothetical protein